MSRPKVYLAGTIGDLTFDEAGGWRVYARRRLATMCIDAVSPMRAVPNKWGQQRITPECTGDAGEPDQHALKRKCAWDAWRCDAVLAHFGTPGRVSIGTVLELAWADTGYKPIVGVLPEGNPHDHPLVRETLSHRVSTLDDGINAIKALFAEG